jgi:hypothetical protein
MDFQLWKVETNMLVLYERKLQETPSQFHC